VKINRRAALAGAVALPFIPAARAQDFPSKPIKIVVPFAPGSATDITARGLAAKLQEILKQPVIVDDKPGASGQLGASAVATAPADGYTLMMGTNTTNAANGALFNKLSYDPEKDFAPIMRCVTGSHPILANPMHRPSTVKSCSTGVTNSRHGRSVPAKTRRGSPRAVDR